MTESLLVKALSDALEKARQTPYDPPGLEKLLLEAKKLAQQQGESLAHAQNENQSLAMFYTLQQRLFEDLRVDKVGEAICETAINFLGTEDFAVYVRGKDDFRPINGMGKSYTEARPFKPGEGARGALVQSGESTYGQNGLVAQASLTRPGGGAIGYLEVGTLLRHKPRLSFEDRELLSVLRQRGGAALALALEHHPTSFAGAAP